MNDNQVWTDQCHMHSVSIMSDTAPVTPPKCSSGREISDVSGTHLSSKSFSLSPDAPEFYPRNYHALCAQKLAEAVAEVRRAIVTMSRNPAEFFNLVDPLSKYLSSSISDTASLNAVVEEIFQQAVLETNFRNTGARACGYLSDHLKIGSHGGGGASFQQQLSARCQQELEFFLVPQNVTPGTIKRFVGFSLFMGELLVDRKSIDEGRHELVSDELPLQVCRLIRMLVATSTDPGLRCTVQLLKMTGAVLDDHRMGLDDICAVLQDHVGNPDTNPTLRQMMVNTLNVRSSNWGRTEGQRETMEGAGDTKAGMLSVARNHKQADDEQSMLYNCGGVEGTVGGQMLTCEEQALCDEFDGALAGAVSPSDGSPSQQTETGAPSQYLIGDQEMDAETASAFDQFIASCEPQRESQPSRPPVYNNCWTYQP